MIDRTNLAARLHQEDPEDAAGGHRPCLKRKKEVT
jgi:hypothetical protein